MQSNFRPDPFIYNTEKTHVVEMVGGRAEDIWLGPEGFEWWMEWEVTVQCPFNFAWFPFDTQVRPRPKARKDHLETPCWHFQTCPFKVISISSTIDSVVFKSGRLVDQTGATRSSLEYEVEYRTLPEGTVEVDDLFPDEAYAVAGFTVALRRGVLSHVMNTFLPSLLMVITASVRSVSQSC